jgi:hypothetical protein
MLGCGDGVGFTFESFAELRGGDLDRDIPIQPRIVRAVHFPHPALANRREDLVGAEFVAYRKGHLGDAVKF